MTSACLIFLFISLELKILLPSQQNPFYQSCVKGDSCMRDSFGVLYKCKHYLDLCIYKVGKYDRDWLRLVYTQISPGHIWTTLYVYIYIYIYIYISCIVYNLIFRPANAQYINSTVYFVKYFYTFRLIYIIFREPFLTHAKVTKSIKLIKSKSWYRWLSRIINVL